MKRIFFIAVLALCSGSAYAEQAAELDMSKFAGTMSVEFHSMQAAGVLGGCTLVYNLVEQDRVPGGSPRWITDRIFTVRFGFQ